MQIAVNENYKEKYGFKVADRTIQSIESGVSEKAINELSSIKREVGEHAWIHEFRMKGLKSFLQRPLPKWGPDLSDIDFDDIVYYAKPMEGQVNDRNQLPEGIKQTFEKLGIPEAERKF